MVLAIGNPGAAYAGTRHNIGFAVVDEVARRRKVCFRKANALFLEAETRGGRLIKPLTWVNRSGRALEVLLAGGLRPEHLLVVVDDLNLEVGRMRFRARGSDGGHNGLKDIARALGSGEYARLRIGVSHHRGGDMKEHVLGAFEESEAAGIRGVVSRAAQAVEEYLNGCSVQELMRTWNGTGPPPGEEQSATPSRQ